MGVKKYLSPFLKEPHMIMCAFVYIRCRFIDLNLESETGMYESCRRTLEVRRSKIGRINKYVRWNGQIGGG